MDNIVITGLSGRYPDADSTDELWDKLLEGKVLYNEERDRHPKKLRNRPSALGQIKDLTLFDHKFFGFSKSEADMLGPQSRILHEVTYEALWDAGINPESLRGSRTGLFIGISVSDGPDLYEIDDPCEPTFLFSRMAYYYDWRGPCVVIDTACASTLDAIVQAHWYLKKGLCDLAVVAGVNTIIDPFVNITAMDMKMLSASGYERCLDEDADGFIRSETIAVLILQHKSSAKRFYGEILGTSVNNDGYTEEGITFPNRKAQADAMRSALRVAKIDPAQIDYIEAHITGTQAGDAVETSAILDAYRENSSAPIRVGCIKSNIGHGEATAGINAVTRACKILQTGFLSPNAAYKTPNSRIPGLKEGKIIPVLTKQPLNSELLGVNTFGFGGANGHIILRGNQKKSTQLNCDQLPRLTLFCNRTYSGIQKMAHYLENQEISEDYLNLINELAVIKPNQGMIFRGYGLISKDNCVQHKVSFAGQDKRICFVFGESVLSTIYTRFQVFRDSLQKSVTFLTSHGIDLKPSSIQNGIEEKSASIDLVTKQLAMIDLLSAVGVKPDLVIGQSVSSLAAQYAADQLNFNSVLKSSLNGNYRQTKKPPFNTSQQSTNNLDKYLKTIINGFSEMKPFSTSGEVYAHLLTPQNETLKEISPDDWLIVVIDSEITLINHLNKSKSQLTNGCDPVKSPPSKHQQNSVDEAKLLSFLKVLGQLYLSGVNIDLYKLYPSLGFPVGRQCPSISSFLDWDHSEKFSIFSCHQFYENMTNLTYSVDLTDPEYEEVAHHVYDDRILMPAVGYIYLLWKNMVFNEYGDSVNFKDHGFRVWDVRIHRATIIQDSTVFKVYYNKSIHKFAVAVRDQVCVSGYGQLLKNSSVDFESYMKVETDPEAFESDGDRFYLGLKIQGFQYGPKMKNVIATSTDHSWARVKYSGGWIGLADSMIQLGGLATASRSPRVPVGFQELVYDPEVFKEALEMAGDLKTVSDESEEQSEVELEVFYCDEIGSTATYGMLLKGLSFTTAPSKPEQPDLRYARQIFKPYHHATNCRRSLETLITNYFNSCKELLASYPWKGLKDDWSVYANNETRYKLFSLIYKSLEEDGINRLSSQIVQDPSLLMKDHVVDLIYDHVLSSVLNVYEGELAKKMIVSQVIGLNKDQTGITVSSHLAKFAIGCDVIASEGKTKADLLIYNHHSLNLCGLISENSLHSDNELRLELESREPGSFCIVVYRTKLFQVEETFSNIIGQNKPNFNYLTSLDSTFAKLNFIKISSCEHESGLVSILFKKRPILSNKPPKVIKIDGLSCNWVDDIQEALDDKEVERAWLIANDSYRNGILGLVKCLRFEPFGDKLRSILWPGRVINDDLSGLEDIVYKDLVININKDGEWGTFHLDEIPVDEEVTQETTNCFVDVGKKGDLTSLTWFKNLEEDGSTKVIEENESSDDPREKGLGHESVNTYYSALNFRDILLATGRLSSDAYPPNDVETLIGTEFSGKTDSGRRVMGICHGKGIATRIPGKNISIVFDVPSAWSLAEAATIPNVYLTVYYALIIRGGLKNGETVLIHSGSGGVGQAAISLCLARNCKVFTTVSTQEKRDFLKSMFPSLDDNSFADSRSTSFEDHILRQTQGRGVDIVLNSLVEDKLQAGLRCLAEGGRFLELGKYDIIQNNNFDQSSLKNNTSFQVICLSFVITKICENSWEGRQLAELFQTFFHQGIESGEIKPIRSHVYNKNQVEDAFRLMAKSRHLGKVLIKLREETSSISLEPMEAVCRTYFHPHKCYIIIGGLGGMGLELAYWMVTRGAHNLIITTRSGFKSDNDRNFIEFLRRYSNRRHNVIVTINDCMSQTLVNQLIDSATRLGPIGGIFNLAMVLKDGLLENQTSESFEAVCGPKVHITQLVDRISRKKCPYLDHFVCFSSIATLGSLGQSNYAFANSFMERVCEERRSEGLPGLAVQWGPVADVGIAARLVSEKDLIIFGFASQNIFSCFRALDKFMQLSDSVCQSCVISSGTYQESPLFENIFQRIAHILGIKDIDALDPSTTLNELGLDSLQSIEVKEYFGRQYNLSLEETPLGNMKISDIRDLSKSLHPKDDLKEEALD